MTQFENILINFLLLSELSGKGCIPIHAFPSNHFVLFLTPIAMNDFFSNNKGASMKAKYTSTYSVLSNIICSLPPQHGSGNASF